MPGPRPDRSPVTAADHAAEAVILAGLARELPGVPVVSEEAAGHARRPALADSFFLVDPLDGTREFLAGRDEFTVNIAIVRGGRPVLGIVAAPALGLLWRGSRGGRAERLRLAPGAPASAAQERSRIRCRALAGERPHRGSQPLASRCRHAARFWRGCRRSRAGAAARR